MLKDERTNIADALEQLGKFGALATQAVQQTKDALVQELKDLVPVLKSLADAGPSLIESLGFFATYPYPKDTLDKWIRGDYGNLTAVLDLTLSRIDAALFTGTRFEGNLTQLEMQWGRTIGQMPSPYTGGESIGSALPLRSRLLRCTWTDAPACSWPSSWSSRWSFMGYMIFDYINLPKCCSTPAITRSP